MMPAGTFRESKVEAQAFSQKAGEVSGVIEGQSGTFIVKTLEVKEGGATPFEEAQAKIDDKLREEKYKQLQDDYFRLLREKANIIPSATFQHDVLVVAVQQYYKGGSSGAVDAAPVGGETR